MPEDIAAHVRNEQIAICADAAQLWFRVRRVAATVDAYSSCGPTR